MNKKIVVPGELVTAERKRLGSNVFLREGKIFSESLGFVNETDTTAAVVPLAGLYEPLQGDVVVGIVAEEKFSVYGIDINSIGLSFVSKKDFRDPLHLHSFVSAKVMRVNEMNEVDIGYLRVLFGGEVFDVNPVKVPRVIGRNGSMLEVLKNGTGCNFFVGKNGKIWVKGGKVDLLKNAIEMIDSRAHEENLTNTVKDFLDKENSNSAKTEVKEKGDVNG